MVLAVLANQYAPSSRGLIRKVKPSSYDGRHQQDNNSARGINSHQTHVGGSRQRRRSIWAGYDEQQGTRHLGQIQEDDDYEDDIKENEQYLSATSSVDDTSNLDNSLRQTPSVEALEHDYNRRVSFYKRKPFRAMSALTSVAADLDVIGDWWFYISNVKEENSYRADLQAQQQQGIAGVEDIPMYRIPPWLMTTLFITCIAGTFLWLVLATDGRFLTPLLQRLQIDSLSMGTMLFLCVVIEDIPQVVLTFLVEDYYEEETLSNVALINLMASLYDMLIKLAEAYDERNDIVETGVWIRDSIWAHKKDVTSIIVLPMEEDPPKAEITAETIRDELCGKIELSASSVSSFDSTDNTYILDEEEGDGSGNKRRASWVHSSWRRIIGISRDRGWVTHSWRRAVGVDQKVPHIQFLTSSLDSTIRFWDTNHYRANHRRKHCVRTLRNESRMEGITCLTLFGKNVGYGTKRQNLVRSTHRDSFEKNPGEDKDEELNANDTFIIAGSINGTAYLWTMEGKCIRKFNGGITGRVTSVATIDPGKTFVCGYVDSRARIWDAVTGSLLHQFVGHRKYITSVCSMEDGGLAFITGSADESIKLWHADDSTDILAFSSEHIIMGRRGEADNYINAGMQKCKRTFVGHTGPILSLACVESGTAFVSGSEDHTARLWNVERGYCIRVFSGHQDAVSCITVLDEETILTGSRDRNIKLWDAVSSGCIRTYSGHTGNVTSISLSQDESYFLSSSADRTVKIWAISIVPKKSKSDTLDQILNMNDSCCAATQN